MSNLNRGVRGGGGGEHKNWNSKVVFSQSLQYDMISFWLSWLSRLSWLSQYWDNITVSCKAPVPSEVQSRIIGFVSLRVHDYKSSVMSTNDRINSVYQIHRSEQQIVEWHRMMIVRGCLHKQKYNFTFCLKFKGDLWAENICQDGMMLCRMHNIELRACVDTRLWQYVFL